MSFTSLGLSPSLLPALDEQGYSKAYPIQEQAIPPIINKHDILGIAKTGSGKTASYALPILTNLEGKTSTKNRYIDALILVPTRELAVQVEEVFRTFGSALSQRIKTMAVYGGVSINPQMMKMQGVNILIATPGRLIELVESNAMSLSEIRTLVLDEADKMLNLGFKDEMDKIFSFLPKKRQNLLFSATLSDKVDEINRVLLNNPVIIKIEEKDENINLINQTAYYLKEEEKGPFLRYLIKNEDLQQVLIFTSSTYKADNVADKLRTNGIDAQAIHGKKSNKARTDALKNFKRGALRVLVATDILARGIDIEFLPCVINYELPRSPKDYIHRIGRTGRAESPGDAITFVTIEDQQHFKVIQKKMKKRIELQDIENLNLQGY
ncbi:MAG: DEAD/DEAH box helicase [Ichthyobacteriaceae bacterium]|nr:DEAD/DEAH box helicase [Ichthyobacteriaceae bacterium]